LCGIIGVTCSDKISVKPGIMVYNGLIRLEYRGYDSAGVASVNADNIIVVKGKGKIAELEKKYCLSCIEGYTIIGHTRWATHGAPSDVNAHPHIDCTGRIAVVHNGIIQNYRELKNMLISKGHVFKSETDTEVIPHLIEELYNQIGDFYLAFKTAVKMLEGSYAIAVVTSIEPNKIFFAKKDSPLIIGLGDGFNALASDIPALLEYTRKVITVRDGWIGYIDPSNVFIEDVNTGSVIDPLKYVRIVEWSLADAVKGGYRHFMLKEIFEQPRALKETFYGIVSDYNLIEASKMIMESDKVFITGAGTSYHASLYFALLTNRLTGKLVHPFIASEYYNYVRVVDDDDALIVVSQSGETMDSLKALRAFRERGAKIIAVSNVIDSSIPRESDIALYTRAGPEIGVAATKTFTTQTLLLVMLSIGMGEMNGSLTRSEAEEYRGIVGSSGEIVSHVLSLNDVYAKELAEWLKDKSSVYYLSRGIGVPVAMEGALKLKEIAYIHAESYPAGESKHGPIALVEKDYPVIFIIPSDEHLEKLLLGNIQEMKARGATIIGVAPEDTFLVDQLDYWFKIPSTHWIITPITHTPPLQLLAYHTSVARGFDPDKPRNLAKTVTVE